MSEQNTDFALTPDGSSTAPPQADDPRYTPALQDETGESKERDNRKGGGSASQQRQREQQAQGQNKGQQSQGEGAQGQAEEHGGRTNADADPSDPNKTVKDTGPVVTPGTTDTSKSGDKSKK